LTNIEVKNKIALYHTTLEMLAENKQPIEANSKMMRWTKGAYDVDVQVFFQQNEDNLYQVSLRSELYDMSMIAQFFGGGGHKKAAGFEVKSDFNTIKNDLIRHIEETIYSNIENNDE
jgi:phosphoesterase RecJ-like protein